MFKKSAEPATDAAPAEGKPEFTQKFGAPNPKTVITVQITGVQGSGKTDLRETLQPHIRSWLVQNDNVDQINLVECSDGGAAQDVIEITRPAGK